MYDLRQIHINRFLLVKLFVSYQPQTPKGALNQIPCSDFKIALLKAPLGVWG
jgi:hypothetical protein